MTYYRDDGGDLTSCKVHLKSKPFSIIFQGFNRDRCVEGAEEFLLHILTRDQIGQSHIQTRELLVGDKTLYTSCVPLGVFIRLHRLSTVRDSFEDIMSSMRFVPDTVIGGGMLRHAYSTMSDI